jgi:hypothetical protein
MWLKGGRTCDSAAHAFRAGDLEVVDGRRASSPM